jgi:hypothetical protein
MSNGRKYEIPCMYQVKVKGTLTHDWSSWFEGFSMSLQNENETLLIGLVEDQAALHGLLVKIASLGLPLLSVTRLEVTKEYSQNTIEEKGEHKNEHSH